MLCCEYTAAMRLKRKSMSHNMSHKLKFDFVTRKNQKHQGIETFDDYDAAQNRYHELINPFIKKDGLRSDNSKIVEINGIEWER
jgi:hypothetical protein